MTFKIYHPLLLISTLEAFKLAAPSREQDASNTNLIPRACAFSGAVTEHVMLRTKSKTGKILVPL